MAEVRSPVIVLLCVLLCCFVLEITGNVVHMEQSPRLVDGGKQYDVDGLEFIVNGCSCQKETYTCSCCIDMNIPEIGLKEKACLDVKYIPKDVGLAVDFSLNGVIIISEEVSARNPPPLCIALPKLKKEASLCLELYDLDVSASKFSGCAKVEAKLALVFVKSIKLGCFHIPVKGVEHKLEHEIGGKM